MAKMVVTDQAEYNVNSESSGLPNFIHDGSELSQ
jgi:hypothetical protein